MARRRAKYPFTFQDWIAALMLSVATVLKRITRSITKLN
jgi:hypothetical protein